MLNKVKIHYLCHQNNLPSDFLIKLYIKPTITREIFDEFYKSIYDEILPNNINLNNENEIMDYIENLFFTFNSDNNPLSSPNIQKKLKEFNSHTSMSMGDIVQINNDYYMVAGVGFNKITL